MYINHTVMPVVHLHHFCILIFLENMQVFPNIKKIQKLYLNPIPLCVDQKVTHMFSNDTVR